jgi:hypothetical protein
MIAYKLFIMAIGCVIFAIGFSGFDSHRGVPQVFGMILLTLGCAIIAVGIVIPT